jgi:type II secretory pathway component PulF
MEPAMMVFLGGIVVGLLIAMYVPIFELAGNVRAG